MNTATLIQKEIISLPSDLQSKVLAYVEWLKYRDLVLKAAQLATDLGGISTLTEEDSYQLFEQSTNLNAQETVEEKVAVIERVNNVLNRMRLGGEGISNHKMKDKAKQWRKQ